MVQYIKRMSLGIFFAHLIHNRNIVLAKGGIKLDLRTEIILFPEINNYLEGEEKAKILNGEQLSYLSYEKLYRIMGILQKQRDKVHDYYLPSACNFMHAPPKEIRSEQNKIDILLEEVYQAIEKKVVMGLYDDV